MANVGITTVVRVPVRLKPDDAISTGKQNLQGRQSLALDGPVVVSTVRAGQLPGALEESELSDLAQPHIRRGHRATGRRADDFGRGRYRSR